MLQTLTRIRLYSGYAVRDVFCLRFQLLIAVAVVCGSTVSLSLLLGFRDALQKQLEDDLRKSPSTIEIAASVTPRSKPFATTVVRDLRALKGVVNIIPDTTKVIGLARPDHSATVSAVTARATKLGDPLLAFYGTDVLRPVERGVVLSTAVADALRVGYVATDTRHCAILPGQSLTLSVTRQERSGTTEATADFTIRGVIPLGTASVVYLEASVMDRIESFQLGRSIPEFGWSGYARSADADFEAYLAFAKAPLSPTDELKLKANGLAATLLDSAAPADGELRVLYGLLREHELLVYRFHAEGADPQDHERPRLTRAAAEIEQITDIDEIVIPWTTPVLRSLEGTDHRIVGLTAVPRWLKTFLIARDLTFFPDDEEFQIKLPGEGDPAGDTLALSLDARSTIALRRAPVGTPTVDRPSDDPDSLFATIAQTLFPRVFPTPQRTTALKPLAPVPVPVAVVPATLVAHLVAADRGGVAFDDQLQLFVDRRAENAPYQARFIAADIHAVPLVDDLLQSLGYATQSQRLRVEEIESYARTLSLLVAVVGGTLFVFNLWTLTFVMTDSSFRKQKSIALLRTMGTGGLGIFYIVLVRGLVIGIIAGTATVPASWGLARLFTDHVAPCLVAVQHLEWVGGTAVAACVLGSIPPALWAARVSPGVIVRDGQLI